MFTHGELPGRVDRAAERRARAVRDADRPRQLRSTASCGSTRTPTSTSTSASASSARGCATTASSSPTRGAWKPNLTLNLGLRYELQLPFYPRNNSYSKATHRGRLRRSGVAAAAAATCSSRASCPGSRRSLRAVQRGRRRLQHRPEQLRAEPRLRLDARRQRRLARRACSAARRATACCAAGYTLAYNRPGMSDFTGAIDDNPGISQTANRNHALGNLGTPGIDPAAQPRRPRPAAASPTTRVYPMTDVVTGDITDLRPEPAGAVLADVDGRLAAQARPATSRSKRATSARARSRAGRPTTTTRSTSSRTASSTSSGWRRGTCRRTSRPAAATRSPTPARPAPSPLPIFLAYFNGLGASAGRQHRRATPARTGPAPRSTASSRRATRTRSAWSPTPTTTGLIDDATRRDNALDAGLPANFFVANPDLLGGAEVVGNGGYTRYNSLQLELRKRLSHGLQFQTQLRVRQGVHARSATRSAPRASRVPQTGTVGGVTHAFKANWIYELPFGQGRRFGGSAGRGWTG